MQIFSEVIYLRPVINQIKFFMKKLMYLLIAALMVNFTACGGGETATEEVVEEVVVEEVVEEVVDTTAAVVEEASEEVPA